jgi:hypothetical protein
VPVSLTVDNVCLVTPQITLMCWPGAAEENEDEEHSEDHHAIQHSG